MAVSYLQEHGYQVLERNFRCKLGEVDVIALCGEVLVFVEVKYRASATYGHPYMAVDKKKQVRISNVASYYIYSHRQYANYNCRFDVVSITGDEIALYKNAFSYCGGYRR